MIKQINNQSIRISMHLPSMLAKPSHRLLVLSHANLCGDDWIYLAVDTACMPMAGSLPSSVIDGIDSLRNIEKVAGETSASQASLLKQLSELEQALISVTSSLPSTEFVAQLDKLQSVQLRLQGVLNRLSIVEARTVKIQAYLSNSAK
ncbi:TPA: hypothetical protein ACH3X3_004185 [Trebouxia sp. C0006]